MDNYSLKVKSCCIKLLLMEPCTRKMDILLLSRFCVEDQSGWFAKWGPECLRTANVGVLEPTSCTHINCIRPELEHTRAQELGRFRRPIKAYCSYSNVCSPSCAGRSYLNTEFMK